MTAFTLGSPGEAPELMSQPETPAGRVAGYGLQTLGSRELIVKFAPDAVNPRPSRGTFVSKLSTGSDLYQLDSEPELQAELEELWEREDCLLAEPNASFQTLAVPTEYSNTLHPHLTKIRANEAWVQTIGSGSVVVAVVDSGISVSSGTPTHNDLRANLVPSADWINVNKYTGGNVADRTDVNDGTNSGGGAGHGTRVAGVIAAVANNGGAVGVAPGCKLLPVRANTHASSGLIYTTVSVANGIKYAVTKPNVKVINLSMGTPIDSPTLLAACDQAVASGVLVVAAAGNNGTNQPMYPAAYDSVLSVTGTTASDQRASFSNFGPWVKMAAPAENIFTALRDPVVPGNSTASGTVSAAGANSGTSYAAAMVSGAAALVRSKNPSWHPLSVLKALQTTGAPTTGFPVGRPQRLDVARALALTTAPPPPPFGVKTAAVFPSATRARLRAELLRPALVDVELGVEKTLAATKVVSVLSAVPTSRITEDLVSASAIAPSSLVSGGNVTITSGKTYFYRLRLKDPAAPTAVTLGPIGKFTAAPPKVKKLTTKAGAYTATLSWTMTAPVAVRVKWGKFADQLAYEDAKSSTALDVATYGTEYEASFTGLDPEEVNKKQTTYYYEIWGRVEEDPTFVSLKKGSFKPAKRTVTATVAAATPDKLVVKVLGKTPHKVSVVYDKDPVAAELRASDGIFVDTGLNTLDAGVGGFALEQPIVLGNLEPNTTYTIIVKAVDVYGRDTSLKPIRAKTLSRGPVEFGIAGVTATGVTVDVHLARVPGELKLFYATQDEYDRFFAASLSGEMNKAFKDSGAIITGSQTTGTNFRIVATLPLSDTTYCGRLRIGAAPYVWSEPFFFKTLPAPPP
jgi:hypothetical protein